MAKLSSLDYGDRFKLKHKSGPDDIRYIVMETPGFEFNKGKDVACSFDRVPVLITFPGDQEVESCE